jgi:cytochrome oxidase Cu insertion factor (SCO1/SenC/PrrC family)
MTMEVWSTRDWMKRVVLLIGTVVLGLGLSGCSRGSQQSSATSNAAPSFTLPSATGDAVSLMTLVGKQPVLLYFSMAAG